MARHVPGRRSTLVARNPSTASRPVNQIALRRHLQFDVGAHQIDEPADVGLSERGRVAVQKFPDLGVVGLGDLVLAPGPSSCRCARAR